MDGITLSYMALDVFIVLLGINVGGEKDKGSMSDLKELLLNKFKKKDESDEAEKVIEVITKILKAIHLKKYEEIIDYVDESEVDDLNEMFECDEKSLEYNGFGSIDEYGAACNFYPQYEYSQLYIYEYDNNSGFAVDYQMTSDSELVDLTLQLEFLYTKSGFKTVFVGIDPA